IFKCMANIPGCVFSQFSRVEHDVFFRWRIPFYFTLRERNTCQQNQKKRSTLFHQREPGLYMIQEAAMLKLCRQKAFKETTY
ncbi:MAG TPA: hypothetical protein DIC22_08330, partial [Chitinophagaceae bacterium]|nr:hypothetical protein [Chitinophagaceae bacterium]